VHPFCTCWWVLANLRLVCNGEVYVLLSWKMVNDCWQAELSNTTFSNYNNRASLSHTSESLSTTPQHIAQHVVTVVSIFTCACVSVCLCVRVQMRVLESCLLASTHLMHNFAQVVVCWNSSENLDAKRMRASKNI